MVGMYSELSAESVEGAALTLERVDDVHGSHRLSLGVLAVRHGITNDVLEEDLGCVCWISKFHFQVFVPIGSLSMKYHLEDAASLFVDEAGDALDSSTTGEATNRRLSYALDVVA